MSRWWKRFRKRHRRAPRQPQIDLRITRLEERRVLDAAGLVADLLPGSVGAEPMDFTEFNGSVYFSADGVDESGNPVGRELYQLSSEGEVSLVDDIRPGVDGSAPSGFFQFRNQLYFSAKGPLGRELYSMNSSGQVSLVADIQAGAGDSNPGGSSEFGRYYWGQWFIVFRDEMYFAADGADGRELYKVQADGQVAQVADILPGSQGSDPSAFVEFDDRLYFVATGTQGRELYATNRLGSIVRISDIAPGSASANPDELTIFNDRMYFSATSPDGRLLYRMSEGTSSPHRISPTGFDSPEGLFVAGNRLFFRANNSEGDNELVALRTNEKHQTIRDASGERLESASSYANFNGQLYFAATVNGERGLYFLPPDATQATQIALPTGVELGPLEPDQFLEFPLVAGDLYFAATGPAGKELYRIDAANNIELAIDVNAGLPDSSPSDLFVFRDKLYLVADDGVYGRELFCLIPNASSVGVVDGKLVFDDVAGGKDNRVVVLADSEFLTIRDENQHDIFTTLTNTALVSYEVVIPWSALVGVSSFDVNTFGGNDSLTLDFTSHGQLLFDQFDAVAFDGGTQDTDKNDVLRIVGGELDVTLDVELNRAGAGQLQLQHTLNQLTLSYENTEPIDVVDVASFEWHADSTVSARILTINNGLDALDSAAVASVLNLAVGSWTQDVHVRETDVIGFVAEAGSQESVQLLGLSASTGNDSLIIDTQLESTDEVSILGVLDLDGEFQLVSGEIEQLEDVTAIGGVTWRAAGGITMHQEASLQTIDASRDLAGEISLFAQGNVQVATLTSSATIRIESAGGLIESVLTSGKNLTATGVTLVAESSIGSPSKRLQLQAALLFAESQTSDIWLDNMGDLEVDALFAGATISLNNMGTLLLSGPVASNGGVVDIHASGTITLTDALSSAGGAVASDVDIILSTTASIENDPGATGFGLTAGGAIQLANGSVVDGRNADISLLATEDVVVSLLRTTAHIDIESTTGSILGTNDAGSKDLIAASASLSADTHIGSPVSPLETQLAELDATSTTGGIWLDNMGNLEVTSLFAGDTISLGNMGTLLLSGSVASNAGGVDINATGTLTLTDTVSSAGGTISSDDNIVLSSTASIENDPGDSDFSLTAGGSIQLEDGSFVDGRDGDINLLASNDVTVSLLETTSHINIESTTGSILDTSDVGAKDLIAASATLSAGTDIGSSSNALETQLSELEANATSGGIWLDNMGNLEVTSLFASEPIVLDNMGTLLLSGPVASNGGVVAINATGTLTMTAALSSAGGAISSDADIVLSSTASIENDPGSSDFSLSAGGSIQLDDGSFVDGRDGDISLLAMNDIIVSLVQTTAHIDIETTAGAILDTSDAGAKDLIAASASLSADTNIGSSSNALETQLSELEANATSGGIWLDNMGNLEVASLFAGDTIVLNNMGTLLLSGPVDSGGGGVDVDATGTLTVTDALTSAGGAIDLSSDSNLILASTALLDSETGSIGINLTAGGAIQLDDGSVVDGHDGDISLLANDDVTVSLLRTTGHIDIDSTTGSILDAGDAGAKDLIANSASLTAANDIGSAGNALESQLSELEATATSGGFWLDNMGDLEVTSLFADDTIVLNDMGTLLLSGPVDSNGGGVDIDATGTLTLTDALTSAGGAIDVSSDVDIILSSASSIDSESGSAGINLTAGGSIQLDDGSVVDARDGDINLLAASDVTVSLVRTTGHVDIDSATGSILDTSDAAAKDLIASSASLSSATDIGSSSNALESQLSELEAAAAGGGIWLDNMGDLDATSQFAGNTIVLNNVGALLLTGPIDSNGGGVDIDSTGTLTLTDALTSAGGAINVSSDVDIILSSASSIDSESGSAGVNLTAGGSIQLADGSVVEGRDGNISLLATSDVTVSLLRTSAHIEIESTTGSILDTSDVESKDLIASSASLSSGINIGSSSNALESQLGELAATATGGGFWLDNMGDLEITSLFAGNTIVLNNMGTLFLSGPVDSNGGGVDIDATGALTLTDALTSGGGAIDVSSDVDIILSSASSIDSESGSAGINLTAGGAIQLDDGSVVDGRDGDISLLAANDVTVSLLRTSAHIDIESATGSILDTSDVGAKDLIATSASLAVATDIGSSSNALESQLSELEAIAASGGIWLDNMGDLNATSLFAGNTIMLNNMGTLLLSGPIDSNGGGVDIDSTGSLTLTDALTSGGGAIDVSSDVDIILSSASSIDSESGSAGVNLTAGGSIQLADGSVVEGRDGNISLLATSDVAVSLLRTSAHIEIESTTGSILDTSDVESKDLIASSASLSSGTDIGSSSNALESQLGDLAVTATGGGFWLDNMGDLEVTSLFADDTIVLNNMGTLLLSGPVDSNGGGVDIDATGTFTLTDALTSGGGAIDVSSDSSIVLSSTASIDSESGSAGINLTAGGAIQLDDGSVVDGRDGDISLLAANDVTVSLLRTAAHIDIESATGSILDMSDAGAKDLIAASASLAAATDIGSSSNALESQLNELEAIAASGGFWLDNMSDLEVASLFAGNTIVLNNMGALLLSGPIDSNGGGVEIDVTGTLTLTDALTSAGGAIDVSSDVDIILTSASSIDSESGSAGVNLTAGGSIQLADGSVVEGRDGNISLLATSDVTASLLRTSAHIEIESTAGSILDTSDAESKDLIASSASLSSGTDIGSSSNTLESQLGELAATATGGGLWLDNMGDLEVTSLFAGNTIVLNNMGTLFLSGPVDSNGGGVDIDVTGALTLTDALTSGGGAIDVSSDSSIVLSSTASIDSESGLAGIILTAGGAIQLADGSVISGRDGEIQLYADQDIVVSSLRTTSHIRVESNSGAILDTDDAGGLDLIGASADLNAAGSIGMPTNPLEAQIGELRANSSSGGVWISNLSTLNVGGVFAGDDVIIVVDGGIRVNQLLDTGGGRLVLDARGPIEVDQSVFTGGNSITLLSGDDLSIAATGSLNSEGGDITLSAAGDLRMASGSFINSGTGEVRLTAGRDIFVALIESGSRVSIQAGQSVVPTGASSLIRARDLSIIAGADIGVPGPLVVDVDNLELIAGGQVEIETLDDVFMGGVDDALNGIQAGGSVHLTLRGQLTVGEDVASPQLVKLVTHDDLRLAGQVGSAKVVLDVGQSILDLNSSRSAVVANELLVRANGSIGAQESPLYTAVQVVAAESHNGVVNLQNRGNLVVGELDCESIHIVGASAVTGLRISADEQLLIDEQVAASSGSVLLESGTDLAVNAPVTAGDGDVLLLAYNDIGVSFSAQLNATDNVSVIADRDADGTGRLQVDADIIGGIGVTTFHASSPGSVFSGSLSGVGGLVKLGSGDLTLTQTSQNSYAGTTQLQGGTLVVDGVIGKTSPASAFVFSDGTALLGSGVVNAPLFSSTANTLIQPTTVLTVGDGSSRAFEFAGVINLANGTALRIHDNDLAQLGALTNIGLGATLDAPNGVEVALGEQLYGDGLITGDLVISNGGLTSPGLSPGILTTRNLNLQAGAIFTVEINGAVPGGQYDQFRANGGVSLANARLQFAGVPFRPAEGTTFVIIENDGVDPVIGRFVDGSGNLINEGSELSFNGITVAITYAGGTNGNDVALTVTDDPIVFIPPTNNGSGGSDSPTNTNLATIALTNPSSPGGGAGRLNRAGEQVATFVAGRDVAKPASENTVVEVENEEFEDVEEIRVRVFFRRVNDVTGKDREKEFDLPVTDIRDVLAIFRRPGFDNGHYRVYVEVPGTARERLILDIRVQSGKIVPKEQGQDKEGGAEEANQPEANEMGLAPISLPARLDEGGSAIGQHTDEIPITKSSVMGCAGAALAIGQWRRKNRSNGQGASRGARLMRSIRRRRENKLVD